MKKGIFLSAIIGLCSLGAVAQSYPDSLKAAPSKEVDYANEVVGRLCDPSMKGRGYAANGDKIAADYITNEYKAIGLTPFYNGSYLQKYDISVNLFPGKMSLQLNGEELKPGVDFLVDASCPSVMGSFKPVYTTRKDIADRMKLMDKLRDAKETFILVDNSSKDGETPEATKRVNDLIEKLRTDPQVQLKGVIIYNPGKINWNTSASQGIRPVLYIAKNMDVSGIKEMKVDVLAEHKPRYETQNIVGMVEGSAKKDSFIVITAHYDHLGLMGSNTAYPGANNSASGMAQMLSLAKHFSIIKPKLSILFVALSGTELGFQGAQAFAGVLPIKPEQIKFVVDFDLMGNGVEGIRVVNGNKFEGKVKEMQKISVGYKLLPKIESVQSRRISNHTIFDEKGIPSVFIYSLGGTVNYKNLNDTPESIPFTKFANTQNLMIRFLETIK